MFLNIYRERECAHEYVYKHIYICMQACWCNKSTLWGQDHHKPNNLSSSSIEQTLWVLTFPLLPEVLEEPERCEET